MTINLVFVEVLIGIAFNTIVTAFYYGKLTQRVSDIDNRLSEIESIHPRGKGE